MISADPLQLEEIERLVRSGRYHSLSEFVRHAMGEALRRERETRVAEQVAQYVAAGHADEDTELIPLQASGAATRGDSRRRRRAKR